MAGVPNMIEKHLNDAESYEKWYNNMIYCLLRSGDVIIDENNTKQRFDTENNRVLSFRLNNQGKSKTRNKRAPDRLWWDKKCNKAISTRKKEFLQLSSNPSRDALKEYRIVPSKVRKTLAKKKRENFREIINDMSKSPRNKKF